jgi:hypothetical protein
LIAQISALRGQLAPKEAELAHVQHMRSFLPGGPNAPSAADDGLAALAKAIAPTLAKPPTYTVKPSDLMPTPGTIIGDIVHATYKNKTIKELTIQALIDHFPIGGTITAIHEFIRDAYGRPLELASLRTQMHRLKADNVLEFNSAIEIWNLDPRKRQLYAMYDHPTSRRDMKELQDDSSDDDNALLEAATKLAWRGDNGDS